MKFCCFICDNLPHTCVGYDITNYFRSTANWIRIRAQSVKIMPLVCIVEAASLLFDRKLSKLVSVAGRTFRTIRIHFLRIFELMGRVFRMTSPVGGLGDFLLRFNDPFRQMPNGVSALCDVLHRLSFVTITIFHTAIHTDPLYSHTRWRH